MVNLISIGPFGEELGSWELLITIIVGREFPSRRREEKSSHGQ
jgi:hypothetical protein